MDSLPRQMLLVGEDLARQKPALDVLAQWGVPAEVAPSGAQALEVVAQGAFDLILIDVIRSVLDGLFVITRLRNLERQRPGMPPAALVVRVPKPRLTYEAPLRPAGVDDVLSLAGAGAAVNECLLRWRAGQYRASQAEV